MRLRQNIQAVTHLIIFDAQYARKTLPESRGANNKRAPGQNGNNRLN